MESSRDQDKSAYRSREGGEEPALNVTPDLSYAFCREGKLKIVKQSAKIMEAVDEQN